MYSNLRVKGRYASNRSWIVTKGKYLVLPVLMTGITGFMSYTAQPTELISQPEYSFVARASEPKSAPTPAPHIPTTVDQMIELEFGEFGPVVVEQAKKVAFCESGKQAYNWNGKFMGVTAEQADAEGRAVGVFQIYRKVHKKYSFESLLDGQYNVFIAKQMYTRSGWNPWLASVHCHGYRGK